MIEFAQSLYPLVQVGVTISVILAVVVARCLHRSRLMRTAWVFALGEAAFWLTATIGPEMFDHTQRQIILLMINITCCVLVMWHPARLIQCWFGACYLTSSILFGCYLIFFTGHIDAYTIMWSGVTLTSILQLCLLIFWTGASGGVAYNYIASRFRGLVSNARRGGS